MCNREILTPLYEYVVHPLLISHQFLYSYTAISDLLQWSFVYTVLLRRKENERGPINQDVNIGYNCNNNKKAVFRAGNLELRYLIMWRKMWSRKMLTLYLVLIKFHPSFSSIVLPLAPPPSIFSLLPPIPFVSSVKKIVHNRLSSTCSSAHNWLIGQFHAIKTIITFVFFNVFILEKIFNFIWKYLTEF